VVQLRGRQRELVKVMDFGISKVREATTRLTREHSVMGTPQYMSPEQALGSLEIDATTDQFALAAIAYEMLTGRAAFRGDNVQAVLFQVVQKHPEPVDAFVPALGPRIAAVVARFRDGAGRGGDGRRSTDDADAAGQSRRRGNAPVRGGSGHGPGSGPAS